MIKMPNKPRKHRWVTEAINKGERVVSVWPSEDDLKSAKSKERFLEIIAKVANDPRVFDIKRHSHADHNVVFLFHLRY
jgi:hypothetical protein